jgi:hypothetical protein
LGDAREAVAALIVANQFLETDLEKPRARLGLREGIDAAKTMPRDCKDRHD